MNYQSGSEQASVAGAAVQLRGVTMRYTRGKEEIRIFEGLDLDIPGGDFVAIMGPSGSGKTSLLNLLAGLDLPAAGTVSVGDDEITALSEGKRARWRAAHVGLVFQFYNLMPVLSAAENVELPLLLTKLPKKRRRENVNAALDLVGLADRARHKPGELSGGQQQRVAIARAIVSDPDIILADEPTGDLDRSSAEEILGILATLNRELNKTIVMVTHDASAAAHARRVLHLEKGVFRLGEGGQE